jgi:hypothetical protein
MSTLAGQKRPRPAFAKTIVGTTIDALAIPVVVVPPPARAMRSFNF